MSLATARKVSTPRPVTKKAAPKAKKQVAERTAEIISGLFPEMSSGARATHRYFATFLTVVSAVGFLALAANIDAIDCLIGRKSEIERTIEILCRRKKNNAILIGEPGVGKTAIAEGLATRIINNDVPEILKDAIIYSLDIGMKSL